MFEFRIAYGTVDFFSQSPNTLSISVKNSNTGLSMRFSKDGIEIRKYYVNKPFYDVPWSISWKRKKKAS